MGIEGDILWLVYPVQQLISNNVQYEMRLVIPERDELNWLTKA